MIEQLQDKAPEPGSGPVLHPFRITFGVRYEVEDHPAFAEGLIGFRPHPDGWVTILATNHVQARIIAHSYLGNRWAFLHDSADVADHPADWQMFPAGELGVWEQTLNPEDVPLARDLPVPFVANGVAYPGFVAGWCGHRVAESEWRAGFRVCERCPAPKDVP